MALKDRFRQLDIKAEDSKGSAVDYNVSILKTMSEKVASIPVWHDYDKDKQFELILSYLDRKLSTDFKEIFFSNEEKITFVRDFLASVHGFGPLDEILSKAVVSAVIVNEKGMVFVECAGVVRPTKTLISEKQLNDIKRRFPLNPSAVNSPVLNFQVEKFFVTIISQPVSENTLIIRKICDNTQTISDLTAKNLITKEIEDFLRYIIKARKNIIISGNINSGKSDFLQTLLNSIEEDRCAVLLEEFSQSSLENDAVLKFAVSSLHVNEFETLLSSSVKLNPDYLFFDNNNSGLFNAFYDFITSEMQGVVCTARGATESSALSKFLNSTLLSQKCTEKQAKLKLSSQFDYIIHLEKFAGGTPMIESIMEITSTKSSSLVQNEVLKLEGDRYILDLPEIPKEFSNEITSLSSSFRSRIRSSLKGDNP